MRVEILTQSRSKDFGELPQGRVLDVPDDTANRWIKIKVAEEVDADTPIRDRAPIEIKTMRVVDLDDPDVRAAIRSHAETLAAESTTQEKFDAAVKAEAARIVAEQQQPPADKPPVTPPADKPAEKPAGEYAKIVDRNAVEGMAKPAKAGAASKK